MKSLKENWIISIKQLKCSIYYCNLRKEFKKSRTYNFLAYSNDPFIEEGPEDFFEMFQNERKYGRMVTDIQLYLEKHPELYEKD